MRETHRQVVDPLGKGSDLPDGPFRVLHLEQRGTLSQRLDTDWSSSSLRASSYLLQVLQGLLVEMAASLEAAALGHLHVHGADELLALVQTLLPQRAEASEGQAARLEEEEVARRKPSETHLVFIYSNLFDLNYYYYYCLALLLPRSF